MCRNVLLVKIDTVEKRLNKVKNARHTYDGSVPRAISVNDAKVLVLPQLAILGSGTKEAAKLPCKVMESQDDERDSRERADHTNIKEKKSVP